MNKTDVKRSGIRSGLHIVIKRPYSRADTHPALLYADADASVYQVSKIDGAFLVQLS